MVDVYSQAADAKMAHVFLMQEVKEEQQAGSPLKRAKVEEQVEDDPPPNPADWSHPVNWIDPTVMTWLETKSEEQTADAAPPPVPEADNPTSSLADATPPPLPEADQ